MDINWALIEEEIIRDLSAIFAAGIPAYPDVKKGIKLFQKVIFTPISHPELRGINRSLPAAMQEAYVDKVGQPEPVRSISLLLEGFLKKLAIICHAPGLATPINTDLMPLIKGLRLNHALSSQTGKHGYPQLTDAQLPVYKGQPDYLEYICEAYLTRNLVHVAPQWTRVETLSRLTSTMVVYLQAVFTFEGSLAALPDPQPTNPAITEKISEEQKYLYYFISFGNTTNVVRNQIVSSYLLYFLKDHPGVTISYIREQVNVFFKNDMPETYYRNIVDKWKVEGRIWYDDRGLIRLGDGEVSRIEDIQENFETNRKTFFLYLDDILTKYNLNVHAIELFDRLQSFIEDNYNIDFAEMRDVGEQLERDGNASFKDFLKYLEQLTGGEEQAESLFRDLATLTVDSDFLIRMCASKAFAKATNPERFEQYIHQLERVVYLDTQIVLFALCLNYGSDVTYDNIFYKNAEQLFDLTKRNKDIKLKVSRLYLGEIAYQLRLALLLIQFDGLVGKNLSTNVFYRFYWFLKQNGQLDAGDGDFSDFMYNWFSISEEDAHDPKYFTIAYQNLIRFLESPDLDVEVVSLPHYPYKAEAAELITQVLLEDEAPPRPKGVVDNDALMICHLANGDYHPIEPFFLTWDKEFTKFRKRYLHVYRRLEPISFHLFSPAKFINHYSLINLKIDPEALTNDFLSLIDGYRIYERTHTVWDLMNKFLNLDVISVSKRRKYVNQMREAFEKELNYTIEDTDDQEKTRRILVPFEEIVNSVMEHFKAHPTYSFADFRNVMLNEEYFEKVVSAITRAVSDQDGYENVIREIDELIQEDRSSPAY
jgi:hypothetical protein